MRNLTFKILITNLVILPLLLKGEDNEILYVNTKDLKGSGTEYFATFPKNDPLGLGTYQEFKLNYENGNLESLKSIWTPTYPSTPDIPIVRDFFNSNNNQYDIFYFKDFEGLNEITESKKDSIYSARDGGYSISYKNEIPQKGGWSLYIYQMNEDFEITRKNEFWYNVEGTFITYDADEIYREFEYKIVMDQKGLLFFESFPDWEEGYTYIYQIPATLSINDTFEFEDCAKLSTEFFFGNINKDHFELMENECNNFPSHRCFAEFLKDYEQLGVESPQKVRIANGEIPELERDGDLFGLSGPLNVPWNIGLEEFLQLEGKESFLFNNQGEQAKEFVNRIYRNRVKETMERDETCIPENVKDHIDELEFPMPDYMVIDFGAGIFLTFEFFKE